MCRVVFVWNDIHPIWKYGEGYRWPFRYPSVAGPNTPDPSRSRRPGTARIGSLVGPDDDPACENGADDGKHGDQVRRSTESRRGDAGVPSILIEASKARVDHAQGEPLPGPARRRVRWSCSVGRQLPGVGRLSRSVWACPPAPVGRGRSRVCGGDHPRSTHFLAGQSLAVRFGGRSLRSPTARASGSSRRTC